MRIKPIVQIYSNYTAEDFQVWQVLFDRQMKTLKPVASHLYLDAVTAIGFRADELPHFEQVNERLIALTGWQLQVAPELVPEDDFFLLLSKKIFPATCWLRSMAELDYLEEPDMFHDVFGHAPLLTNPDFAAFLEAFGKLALQWMHEPEAIKLLARIYWYTIEFGMLMEEGEPKIFGAGIISSAGETKHAMSDIPARPPFDIRAMLEMPYRTDILQDHYFVIDSFTMLCEALPHADACLKEFFSPFKQALTSSKIS